MSRHFPSISQAPLTRWGKTAQRNQKARNICIEKCQAGVETDPVNPQRWLFVIIEKPDWFPSLLSAAVKTQGHFSPSNQMANCEHLRIKCSWWPVCGSVCVCLSCFPLCLGSWDDEGRGSDSCSNRTWQLGCWLDKSSLSGTQSNLKCRTSNYWNSEMLLHWWQTLMIIRSHRQWVHFIRIHLI